MNTFDLIFIISLYLRYEDLYVLRYLLPSDECEYIWKLRDYNRNLKKLRQSGSASNHCLRLMKKNIAAHDDVLQHSELFLTEQRWHFFLSVACERQDIRIVKFFLNNGWKWNLTALCYVLKWKEDAQIVHLFDHDDTKEFLTEKWIFQCAIKYCSITILELLLEKGFVVDNELVELALGDNNMKNVEWIEKKGFPMKYTESVFEFVAERGHIEAINWLLDHDCPRSEHILACSVGHPKVMKLLWGRNFPWNEEFLLSIGQSASLDSVHWIMETLGADCDLNLIYNGAAQMANLEVVKWCLKHHKHLRITDDVRNDIMKFRECYDRYEWIIENVL